VLDGGTHFRVWAPRREHVEVVLEGGAGARAITLEREDDGYFAGLVAEASAGSRYRLRLDRGASFPDPASRFQPDGPHGPSEVVDPAAFRWTDSAWRGRALEGQVLYEMHVGTFTREGTWRAAARELPELADVGITTLEIMPVADFPGSFGWGYDGVDLFAPTRLYGEPDDMRAFVDAAHAAGLAVLLDVVYNHGGPDGNYLREFSDSYFAKRATEWGDAINFDGDGSAPVREFFLSNAAYWIDEFHLDGLRLDATQSIADSSPTHILVELGERVRAAAGPRATTVINENEPQHASLVRPPSQGGCGLDAIWNDDFHHSAMVAVTGRDDAYYTDYRGTAQELLSAAKYGFLFQGQWYRWQEQRRGRAALDLDPARFVHFLENHDQVANSARGDRLHRLTSPGRWRAMTALLLLGPQTPMLFQGQEYASSKPFLFFADHHPELAAKVTKGRAQFLSQFRSLALPEMLGRLAEPNDPDVFERCKLDRAERARHREAYALHRDLLRLRREDPCFSAQRRRGCDGAVLADASFALRFFAEPSTDSGQAAGDRLLVVNLGRALHLDPAPEPLLAPPDGARWAVHWSSEDPRYGGLGTPPLDAAEDDRRVPGRAKPDRPRENWRVPAESAVVLTARDASPTE